jgi:hypothetical protein
MRATCVSPIFLACLTGLFAQAGAGPGASLQIPPVRASFEVDGQTLAITAWGDVSLAAAPDMFRVTITADLGDLQKNIRPLLGAELNRSDRCGERLSVEHASLVPSPSAAVLTANVYYERWACAKVLGKQVVKRLVGGNGVVDVRLTPSPAPEGISLSSEVLRADADGSLGELLRTGSLGATVRDKIAASIQKAVRKGVNLQSILPASLENLAAIRGVEFSDGGNGQLRLSIRAEARLPAEQFQLLNKQLNAH